jgi:hypothetical protein
MYISGLLASTTYYYRACAYSSLEVCAPEDSFTTLPLPNPHPALPTAPTLVDVTYPSCANGRLENCTGGVPPTYTVGSNCDDPSTGLAALYHAAPWGSVIQVPVTTLCQNNYAFVPGTAWDGIGEIIVQSQNVANLLPGVRVQPADAGNMVTANQSFYIHQGVSSLLQSSCYPGGFEWDDTGGDYPSSANITAVTSTTEFTINASNLPNIGSYFRPGQYIWVGNQTGSSNSGYQIASLSGNTITLSLPLSSTPNINDQVQLAPGFYMHYCGADSVQGTISNVVYNSTASGGTNQFLFNVTLSSPVTAVAVGQWGYMTGIGGIPKANGSFQVTSVTNTSSFVVQLYNSYVGSTSASYTGGGTLTLFDWQNVSYTPFTGASPSASCTPGTTAASAWAYSNQTPSGGYLTSNLDNAGTFNNTNYSTARVWRCTAPNTWSPHYILYSSSGEIFANPAAATFDLSQAAHTWVVGFNFTNTSLYNDPLLYHSGQTLTSGEQGALQGGSAPGFNIYMQNGTTQDVHIDRCLFTRPWPAKGAQFVQFNGSSISLTNSYLQNAGGNWWGHEDRGPIYDNSAGSMVIGGQANRALLDNNYFEHYGITVHFDDSGMGGGFAHATNNVTVSRNTFFRNFALIDQAPGSTVNYYRPLRQHLEFKSGVNVDINGNIFSNNFRNVSQAAAIALTPEAYPNGSPGIYCVLSYSGSSGTFTVQGGTSYTVNVGDWVFFPNNGGVNIYQVTGSTPASNQFVVGSLATGLPSPLFVTVLTGADGVSDVNIRNNTFNNFPTILDNYSRISHDPPSPGGYRISEDRVAFQNNLINQFGPGSTLSVPYAEQWQGSGATGQMVNIWGGQVDWIFNHNTIYEFNPNPNYAPNAGTIIQFVNNDFPQINILENEGLVYQNNLEWTASLTDPVSVSSQSGAGCAGNGNAVMNCWMTGSLPYSMIGNATFLPGGNPGGYSVPNFWANFTGALSPFTRPSAGNFELLYNSCCISGGPNPALDGLDEGANTLVLAVAQGQVSSVRTIGIATTTSTVTFTAPDTNGCSVDFGTDPNFGSYTRVLNAGGARNQSVVLSPLVTRTQYFYRVNCQTLRPTGNFVTR